MGQYSDEYSDALADGVVSMRAAIYARYSTDLQSEASIEDQVRLCRERIEREGWRYIEAYTDRAMSGASRLRASYQQMLEDARRERFDVVVAESLDRLSRDQEDTAHLYKHLSFAGVKLVTLSEGEISELHIGLSGTMGALQLKQLAEKTRRGLRGRVEVGRSGGGNSYGYDVLTERKIDGRPDPGARRINVEEAKVVLRIHKMYIDGVSPRTIAKTLNADGVPGPSGTGWGPSTINGNAARGTGILNNELYVGRLVWNRLRYMKDPSTGKRRSRSNPVSDQIVKDVPHLRILPQPLWDAVKARQRLVARDTRPDRRQGFWVHQRPRYLLSGLMKCGECGASFTKYGTNRFACTGMRDRGACTNRQTVRGDDVECAILEGLKSRLLEPQLFEEFAREFTAEVNRQRSDAAHGTAELRRKIDRLDVQIARLVEAIITGADAKSLNSKLKSLEAEQQRARDALHEQCADRPLLHPNLAKIYRAKVESLGDALRDPANGREAFELVRSLIEEVRILPCANALSLELKGDLAGILAMSDNRPDHSGTKALQIKMVAGIGFEPMTFRL